jgi:membrane protease YdiL (CAAX protease family)
VPPLFASFVSQLWLLAGPRFPFPRRGPLPVPTGNANLPDVAHAAVPPEAAASGLSALLSNTLFKALLPLPVFFLVFPLIYWFFRDTWRELDREAVRERGALIEEGLPDHRPLAAFVIMGFVLTWEEYFGGRPAFEVYLFPWLNEKYQHGWSFLHLVKYHDLWAFSWWSFSKVTGYFLIPFPLWKLLFPKDSLLDMGLRVRGFTKHLWIYGLCLAVVLPLLFLMSRQFDFGSYYPFYKTSSRSWFDFGSWELMYFTQFFCLELFFRGFMLNTLRKSLGSAAIFAVAVPYCMIHYGKPYLESHGAIIAGVVLGSLAMRTRSIYAGFLVHITVALGMDWLSLLHRDALPKIWISP